VYRLWFHIEDVERQQARTSLSFTCQTRIGPALHVVARSVESDRQVMKEDTFCACPAIRGTRLGVAKSRCHRVAALVSTMPSDRSALNVEDKMHASASICMHNSMLIITCRWTVPHM
jgi:hypothetical protein